MKKLINLPLIDSIVAEYDSDGSVSGFCNKYKLDGIEAIWGGSHCERQGELPIVGWHLGFYCDWLDFWLQDEEALLKKFGDYKTIEKFYGGMKKDTLLKFYEDDLKRADEAGAEYVVFHVSDVSIEEGYTYEWLHTHEHVIEESVNIINKLLDGKAYKFKFLMENLHWAGLTFENPEHTKLLLDNVHYKNKGIMLDTGHLFCTNLDIKTEDEGAYYVLKKIREHETMLEYVKGIHLHQSVSGEYTMEHTGCLPELPKDYFERFSYAYGHILNIDRHEPFHTKKAREIIEAAKPEYLVHELSGSTKEIREERLKIQKNALHL